MAATKVVKLKADEVRALTKLCVFPKVCVDHRGWTAYYDLVAKKLATVTYRVKDRAAPPSRQSPPSACFKITALGKKALQHCLAKRK